MMAGWDTVYRKIRKAKLEAGCVAITETESSNLYKHNVIQRVRKDHEAKWNAVIGEV